MAKLRIWQGGVMRAFLGTLVIIFGITIFWQACTENVLSSYQKEISTTPQSILIHFKVPITQDPDGIIHQADEDTFTLNGKHISAKYVYKSPYELLIMPNMPLLAPNTTYKLAIKLSNLADSLLTNFLSLSLHTQYTQIAFSQFTPIYTDSHSFSLHTEIALSQKVDISSLLQAIEHKDHKAIAQAISFKDDENNHIPFTLLSIKDKLFLETPSLEIKKGSTNYTLTLKASYFGLKDDESLHYIHASSAHLEVIDIQAINAQTPYIQVHFSANLANEAHLQDFISITPHIQSKVSQQGNTLRIDAPFQPSQTYLLRIKEGIKGIGTSHLLTPKEEHITFHQIPPALAFSQQGVFLPHNAQDKIAFKSINVKNVNLKVSKIYPNNTTAYLYKQNLIGDMQYHDYSNEYYGDYGIYADFKQLGDVELEQTFSIDYVKNQWIQSEIDLSSLKDKQGIFILSLSFTQDDVDYEFLEGTPSWRKEQFFNQASIEKHLIFSNIALLAQQINNKLEVFALDMLSNQPLSSVQIQAISHKNQMLQTLNTNAQGFVAFENAKSILYLHASKEADNTILKLNTPISTEGFDTGGIDIKKGIEAYIYTDRGVYRPGENAYINIIARANAKPITHPIYITIISPQGKSIVQDIMLKDSLFGLFSYTFSTNTSDPSGIYQLKAKVGGSEFWHNISVENIIPNRIKVELHTADIIHAQALKEHGNASLDIKSHYLFGAPASNLNFEGNLFIQEKPFYAPAYSEYTFSHPQSLRYRFESFKAGKLDKNGYQHIDFNLQKLENIGKNLQSTFNVKVFENGGRAVNASKAVDIMLYDSFVGIKAPKNRYVNANAAINLPIIVLSSQTHQILPNHELIYRIYHNSYSWWWDYSNYDDFVRHIKSDKNTKLLQEGTLLSKSTPSTLSFSPNQNGELFIEVEDTTNGAKSAISLYASQNGEPTLIPKLTQLKLQSNKTHYLSTDEAIISFESPKDSKALISIIGQDRILDRFWIDTKEANTHFTLPLKASYAPNIYVAVHVLQDYNTLSNDRSQRLYGVIPIMIEDKDSKLTLNINAPTLIRPNSTFEVKLSNKEHRRVAYSLAIVDEGLLDLTNFSSPNPWAYFYQKFALPLLSFDNYDLIIGRNIGKISQVLKAGGDEAMGSARRKDLSQAQRFKPVVFYSPPIMSDEHGEASFSYDMGAYMGSVRIMAVALDDRAFGSISQNMQVSAPVAMLPTIPRSLKIGDTFSLAIEVLPTQEKVGKATLTLKSGEKIALDRDKIALTFKDKTPQIVYVNAKVSSEHIGQDFIDITLSSGDFHMQEKTDIDILPYNPYITLSKKLTLDPNASIQLENPTAFIKDSQSGYVLISQNPILSIDHRLRWLMGYPYGCIEQTTSSVFPQLFLTTLSKADFIDKPTIVHNINAGIARIGRFQTNDGGFAYWQGGSKPDEWGSAYAGHFLLLAKSLGYYVPENVLKKWLMYEINYVKTMPLEKVIYPLYLLSLAGEPQVGLLNSIYEQHFHTLHITDKWLLAAAYKLAGFSSTAEKMTKDLPTKSTPRDESYYRFSYGSPLRDEAMILQAYIDIYKSMPPSAFHSITQALESNEWYSTQSLAYALLALAQNPPIPQNEQLIDIDFNDKNFKAKDILKVPFSALQGEIHSKSNSPLYLNHVWHGILLEKTLQAKESKIAIKRSFVDENNTPIDVKTLPSGASFYLKLTLDNAHKPVSVSNVAITQNLPSGWEIENTRLNPHSNIPSFVHEDVSYTDIRDDKIMWFVDFNGQKNEMFAKINVITPGLYLLPPAYAEAMYDNSFLANTESLPIIVTRHNEE